MPTTKEGVADAFIADVKKCITEIMKDPKADCDGAVSLESYFGLTHLYMCVRVCAGACMHACMCVCFHVVCMVLPTFKLIF